MKKEFKKILVMTCFILVAIFAIGGSFTWKFIGNHNQFVALNAAMVEADVEPYEPNNIFVKDQTLNDMQSKIEKNVKEFSSWYDENISLDETLEAEKDEVINEDTGVSTKISKIKSLYEEDIENKNTDIKSEIDKLLEEDIDFNKDEQKTYDELKEEADSINLDSSLEEDVDVYKQLSDLKTEVSTLNSDATDRIEKEEKKEAKEEAEKEKEAEAEEEAEKEAEAEEEAQSSVESATNTTTKSKSSNSSSKKSDSSSSSRAPSGSFDRNYSQAVFNSVNAYRSSLGLPAYSYNDSKQSCVDNEALAYASNGAPHNYVCQPIKAENAGYTIDYFYSAGDIVNLWKQDYPHNRPMVSPDYSSMAVSTYSSGGTIYIEACFW